MYRHFIHLLTKKSGIIPHFSNPESTVPISRGDNFILKKNMGSSKKNGSGGKLVYSSSTTGNLSGIIQTIRIKVECKGHGGKTVTLIDGFIWHPDKIEETAKMLKNKCGVGGSVKERVIILQGDVKEKAAKLLTESGLQVR